MFSVVLATIQIITVGVLVPGIRVDVIGHATKFVQIPWDFRSVICRALFLLGQRRPDTAFAILLKFCLGQFAIGNLDSDLF